MTTRKQLIIIAIIFSCFLYFAGVFSGLYASKTIKADTEATINQFTQNTTQRLENTQNSLASTKEELDQVENAIGLIDQSLQNAQLEQLFLDSLTKDQQCTFAPAYFNEHLMELQYYWQRLPFRIEASIPDTEKTQEYNTLKERYYLLSLRMWLLSQRLQKQCDANIISGIQFYSAGCTDCVKQGEELDALKTALHTKGKTLITFSIDKDFNHPVIHYLTQEYNITDTPALLISGALYQGRIFSAEELEAVL